MNAQIKLEHASVDYQFRDVDRNNIRRHLLTPFTMRKKKPEDHTFERVSALSNISLDITEGERVGLVGTNGSGKTTLLKLVSGVLFPSSGTISVAGAVSSIFDPGLGMDPEASGLENIRIRCMLLGIPKGESKEKTNYISKFSELGDALKRPIKTYSSGMAMRLIFSIATCVTPQILVMDEWLSAGDARFVSKALTKMQELIQSSQILVLASHSETVLTEWCNRVIWIQNGHIEEDGDPFTVLKHYKEYTDAG